MATTTEDTHHDNTRRILAFFWSIVGAVLLGWITYKYGHILEILTLIIGLVSGTILGGIFGTYFASGPNSKPVVNQSADSITNSPTVEADKT